MSVESSTQSRGTGQLVWFHIRFRDVGEAALQRCMKRLAAYLCDTGIRILWTERLIGLVHDQRPFTPTDIGLVLSWLVMQREVAAVQPIDLGLPGEERAYG